MECPICYCSQASCKLACKHSFCFDCVKKWYIKCPDDSAPSCPMCRKDIYFRGINNKVDEWEEEHREYIFQKFFEEKLEEILEDINPLSIYIIEYISERLEKIRGFDFIYNEDDIEFFFFNDAVYETNITRDDVKSWQFLLDVSKHPQKPRKKSKSPFFRGFKDYPEDLFYIMYF